MTRPTRWLFAAAACGALLAPFAQALTREEVRADYFEARAAGLLDRPGEAGATEDVIARRAHAAYIQRLVAEARAEMEQERQAATGGLPELHSYVEQGPDGPQVVLMTFAPDGKLASAETMALASID